VIVKQDWPKVIAEIEAAGISLYKIALMLHRQYRTVQRWKEEGAEPKHYEGEMLLEIHAEYVPHETLKIKLSAHATCMTSA
jgi:hypothetical protein